MMALSEDQVTAYNKNGYLFPLNVLDADEVQRCLAALARLEQDIPGALTDQRWRAFPHVYLPWMDRFGHYDLLTSPTEELDAAGKERHRQVYSRFYHEIFLEQYVHHARMWCAAQSSAS